MFSMPEQKLPIVATSSKSEKPWYKNGLGFSCTGCGKCCTGGPGVVWLTEEEVEDIAEYLNMPLVQFTKKYIRIIGDRIALKELLPKYDCVFLKENKCTIYPVRPKQCKSFPFWSTLLESEEAWNEAEKYCEGINCKTTIVSYEDIVKNID